MTIQEFNNLKVGDAVYIRKTKNCKAFATEVTDIDRLFKKIKAICKSKPVSYRYASKKSIPVNSFVGSYKML